MSSIESKIITVGLFNIKQITEHYFILYYILSCPQYMFDIIC